MWNCDLQTAKIIQNLGKSPCPGEIIQILGESPCPGEIIQTLGKSPCPGEIIQILGKILCPALEFQSEDRAPEGICSLSLQRCSCGPAKTLRINLLVMLQEQGDYCSGCKNYSERLFSTAGPSETKGKGNPGMLVMCSV